MKTANAASLKSQLVALRQGVSVIVKTHTADNPVVAGITLSTEVGMMGERRMPRWSEHSDVPA